MSLQDAYVLGQCYASNPQGDFLVDYQRLRIPQTSREVPASHALWLQDLCRS